MARWAYVNGRYLPHPQARVHIEDRGFQFADGVYEVVGVVEGRMVDREGHIARLLRSLGELRMAMPVTLAVLDLIMRELIRRNGVRNGHIYLQITRGVAPRDFKFPKNARPTLVMTTRDVGKFATPAQLENGVSVITIPDIRWLRRDIKSVALLPNVLGKQQAVEAGAFEAWQVDGDGMVNEGCSSNAWIVTADGTLVTRQTDHLILAGITRASMLTLAESAGIKVEIRRFSVAEAYAAREAFLSSATTFAMPITRIDGRAIGDGKPGPVARRLRSAYFEVVCGQPS
ncbi:MAG: D-amino-acid transaminase [Azospirillum sp.]|nr:D-amino-acid transaminase [Azospirillum sp.]